MKVLVTGASGGLGSALLPALKERGDEVVATDVTQSGENESNFFHLDITDPHQVRAIFEQHQPELTFHLAALTDVDRCEIEPDQAFKINALGTENIAIACQKTHTPMVYISTGEVFDGEKKMPYTEYDVTNPINLYGKSKLEGERAVQSLLNRYYIIRTAWLVGGGRKDKKFVAQIVKILEKEKRLKVVNDKFGTPTFVKDLSKNLLKLIKLERYGLYHMTNKGVCSRYEMARKIVEILGKKDVEVIPISSEDFPLAARRGPLQGLANYKLGILGLDLMPSWEKSLKDYLLKEF